jgi:Flp pilus assembly protein CpaB
MPPGQRACASDLNTVSLRSEPVPEPAIETLDKSVLLQLAGCEVAHSIGISWLQRSIAMPVSSVPLSETRIAGRRARDDGLEVARDCRPFGK